MILTCSPWAAPEGREIRGAAAPCALALEPADASHIKFENCTVPLRLRRRTYQIRLLSEVYHIIK